MSAGSTTRPTVAAIDSLQNALEESGAGGTVMAAFQAVKEQSLRRQRIIELVQESLGQLRLDMKYLVFDLEATRRERDAYKAELDSLKGE